jgi:hypothetical protein
MGDVSRVASLVSYLASEEAGFITGARLTIDGGTRGSAALPFATQIDHRLGQKLFIAVPRSA